VNPDRGLQNSVFNNPDLALEEATMTKTGRNPYAALPDFAFWRRSVAGVPGGEVDPVVEVPFTIGKQDRVATAGSCFAQHISKALVKQGFNYLITERSPPSHNSPDENYGTFSARYGNVYTTRQLLQLFERAYGLFTPRDEVWTREDGAFVDPFRPQIQSAGFASREALEANRASHMAAVRTMFETCDAFIFTLGLTECWACDIDGAVVPLAPGVAGHPADDAPYSFHNLDVGEMVDDLICFVDRLRVVNRDVRIILTVSPVPLIATYENRHVLVATTYSKSALRVVAELVCRQRPNIAYFPSYEIITGPQSRHRYFAEDLRAVTNDGVACVMSVFNRHFLSESHWRGTETHREPAAVVESAAMDLAALQEVVCDEEALDS